MTDKTLPERMREAAETLREVDIRHDANTNPDPFANPHENVWRVGTLVDYANRWESDDAESELIEDLAVALCGVWTDSQKWTTNPWQDTYRRHATALLKQFDITRRESS